MLTTNFTPLATTESTRIATITCDKCGQVWTWEIVDSDLDPILCEHCLGPIPC